MPERIDPTDISQHEHNYQHSGNDGHADERGTREYNIALSARRATAAREFLIAQGVSGNRISSIAYGKERPAALCDAEQCWSQNRRAVTVITGGAN